MTALLARRLSKTIYEEFKINPSTVIVWTDSMIVLAWLRSESTLLNQFAQSTSKLSKTSLLNHFSTPCDALQKTTGGLRRSPTIGLLSSELRMSYESCTKKGNDVLKISLQVIKWDGYSTHSLVHIKEGLWKHGEADESDAESDSWVSNPVLEWDGNGIWWS